MPRRRNAGLGDPPPQESATLQADLRRHGASGTGALGLGGKMSYLFGLALISATAVAVLTVVGCGFFTLVMVLAIEEKIQEWRK